AQFDYRSPFKELEKAAAKRQPDFTAFYLYPNVMLENSLSDPSLFSFQKQGLLV
ncbi:MAG: hypothetical protein GQ544_06490, partial [Candidatus Aminicenantes bacterium]|nr:hypothetical protein [Candidatus Aminicenantes bacterium]